MEIAFDAPSSTKSIVADARRRGISCLFTARSGLPDLFYDIDRAGCRAAEPFCWAGMRTETSRDTPGCCIVTP